MKLLRFFAKAYVLTWVLFVWAIILVIAVLVGIGYIAQKAIRSKASRDYLEETHEMT